VRSSHPKLLMQNDSTVKTMTTRLILKSLLLSLIGPDEPQLTLAYGWRRT